MLIKSAQKIVKGTPSNIKSSLRLRSHQFTRANPHRSPRAGPGNTGFRPIYEAKEAGDRPNLRDRHQREHAGPEIEPRKGDDPETAGVFDRSGPALDRGVQLERHEKVQPEKAHRREQNHHQPKHQRDVRVRLDEHRLGHGIGVLNSAAKAA